jgi:hypothetical protein
MKNSCKNCKYFVCFNPIARDCRGECHRNPPSAGVWQQPGRDEATDNFPWVWPDSWCGEFIITTKKIK